MQVSNVKHMVLTLSFLSLLFVSVAYSTEPVVIEFLYRKPCLPCPGGQQYYEIYLRNNQTVNSIERDYGNKVLVERIWFYSEEGKAEREKYGIGITDWNSIIIKHENKFKIIPGTEPANETYIRKLIDFYLGEASSPPPEPSPPPQPLGFTALLMLAFYFGFFETFSPCVIILLSFILSYTLGETPNLKENFLKVMIFGIGFVSGALLLGVAFGLVFLSMPTFQFSLTWIVCVFAIIFGLNLLGLLKIPFETEPLIKKLARKYVVTYAGLFVLGFTFYFFDPCIAPILVSMVPLLMPNMLFLILFVFSIGAFIPFVGVGVFAGAVSKLVRITYRQRFKIRAVSGLILIGYAIYLVIFYLLPNLIR